MATTSVVPVETAVVVQVVKKPGFFRSTTSGCKRFMHRRALESALEKALDAARNHESNGVPRGDRLYQILYDACMSRARGFTDHWGGTMDDMFALYPALVVLKNLAAKPADVDPAAAKAKFVMVVLATFVIVVGAPAICGIMHGIYGLVIRLFGLH